MNTEDKDQVPNSEMHSSETRGETPGGEPDAGQSAEDVRGREQGQQDSHLPHPHLPGEPSSRGVSAAAEDEAEGRVGYGHAVFEAGATREAAVEGEAEGEVGYGHAVFEAGATREAAAEGEAEGAVGYGHAVFEAGTTGEAAAEGDEEGRVGYGHVVFESDLDERS